MVMSTVHGFLLIIYSVACQSLSVLTNILDHYIGWQMPRIKKCIACMKAYFSSPYSSCQLHTSEPVLTD